MGRLFLLQQPNPFSLENGLQLYGPTTDQSANLCCTHAHTHTHTHTSSLQGVCWTKSKVKHEYRGWQANYQMYSSFCIPTSEGKQMWESCRIHSSQYNDMAQQQKAQPSQGIEMDRVVNLALSYSPILWVFTFQASGDVMQCGDVCQKLKRVWLFLPPEVSIGALL